MRERNESCGNDINSYEEICQAMDQLNQWPLAFDLIFTWEYNLNMAEMAKLIFDSVENTEGKGENAG